MADSPRTLDFGLALGGGGAKGLSHIPFLAALDDMNVRPAMISGCSIGAIVGVMYAAGLKAAEMVDWIQNDDWFDGFWAGLTDGRDEGLTSSVLRATLPVHTFAELNIPTVIVASDFWSRGEVVIGEGDSGVGDHGEFGAAGPDQADRPRRSDADRWRLRQPGAV
jgi:NTE family protein